MIDLCSRWLEGLRRFLLARRGQRPGNRRSEEWVGRAGPGLGLGLGLVGEAEVGRA